MKRKRVDQEAENHHSERLIDEVVRRDNYNCQVCGRIVFPKGEEGHVIHPLDQEESVAGNYTVCWNCVSTHDERTLAIQVQKAGELKNAEASLTFLYLKSLFREIIERTRLFVYAGRLLFLKRMLAILVSTVTLLIIIVGSIALTGTLLLGIEAAWNWTSTLIAVIYMVAIKLAQRPWFVIGLLSSMYYAHIVERERTYFGQLQRDKRRGRDRASESIYFRPHWQFVAVFAVIGILGAIDWLLIRADVFTRGSLIGALVLWTIGATGVAYYLCAALHEDRDVSGMSVTPTPWVVISRGALALGLVGGTATTVGYDSLVPNAATILAICLAPFTGGLYVIHRPVRRRTAWRLQPRAVVHFLRTQLRHRILSRVSNRRHSDETESDAPDRETSDRDQQP